MASGDPEMIEEVKALTQYDDDVIDEFDILELLGTAKKEIASNLGVTKDDVDFYLDDNSNINRALFWLTCILTKASVGELASPDMAVGDVEIVVAKVDEEFWREKYNTKMRRASLPGSSTGVASANLSRSNRTYGE